MIISHTDAISLEHILRSVYSCDRTGVSGLVDADAFESKPIYAALLAIAPLHYQKSVPTLEFDEFLCKYETIFAYPEENLKDDSVSNYIQELREIVAKYY